MMLRNTLASEMTEGCTQDYCHWNKTCPEVKLDSLSRIQFYIIDSDADIFEVSIHFKHLLIPGDKIGLSKDQCILGFFKSEEDTTTWHLGTPFLENYYVVYDVTPHDIHNKDYISIGIAKSNPAFKGFEDGSKYNFANITISPDDQPVVP